MSDIQTNPGRIGLTKSTTYNHFLQITDAVSRLTVLLGLASVSSADIFEALLHFVVWYKQDTTFYAWRVKQLRTDAGMAFMSPEFISDFHSSWLGSENHIQRIWRVFDSR